MNQIEPNQEPRSEKSPGLRNKIMFANHAKRAAAEYLKNVPSAPSEISIGTRVTGTSGVHAAFPHFHFSFPLPTPASVRFCTEQEGHAERKAKKKREDGYVDESRLRKRPVASTFPRIFRSLRISMPPLERRMRRADGNRNGNRNREAEIDVYTGIEAAG